MRTPQAVEECQKSRFLNLSHSMRVRERLKMLHKPCTSGKRETPLGGLSGTTYETRIQTGMRANLPSCLSTINGITALEYNCLYYIVDTVIDTDSDAFVNTYVVQFKDGISLPNWYLVTYNSVLVQLCMEPPAQNPKTKETHGAVKHMECKYPTTEAEEAWMNPRTKSVTALLTAVVEVVLFWSFDNIMSTLNNILSHAGSCGSTSQLVSSALPAWSRPAEKPEVPGGEESHPRTRLAMESSLEKMVDPTLAEMGKNLNEAMKMLEDNQRKMEEENEKKYVRNDIPGPLQGSGQDMVSILQLVQNLMHGEEEDESSQSYRLQNVGEQGHMALLGHSLAAYISVLNRERLRNLTTRILSDTTLWLCRLFRYENGSAYYHEDDREGLLKVCRLVIHSCYEDYTVEGFNVLYNKQPVIYISSAARTGLGQTLCNQLGLPLSCMCRVPCNTMFGSQHQMDVALLDRLIKDDINSGKLPLLLVANAGTPGAGHTDKLGRLKELCEQYNMWLHVEGVNLATLALGYVSSSVLAATKCDSMTLTLGSWLGLPAVPAVTLYRHEDPSLSLAAGLTSSQPVEKLRALPLWLSLQYLGHDGIVQRIKHASQLSQRLLENLKNLDFIKTSVEDELSSPVVVFKFSPELQNIDQMLHAGPASIIQPPITSNERHICDTFNQWLGEQLAQLVPASGVDVVELEDEGTCVRFSPLMTSAVLGTEVQDVDQLVDCLKMKIPILTCTLQLREEFEQEVKRTVGLSYIEDLSWPGLGVVRYEYNSDRKNDDKQEKEAEKINTGLLKKLNELESDLTFSLGNYHCW
ncbi:hypothetical protein KIL84_014265 [Mauremys mutica]|uniref:Pyridoxal-dependent decarboxylase domain-containing protein 1 n=1 Tax=Mauremys mutica TaxID=74926 RepID=A0A9D3XN44_9SAUR|nr:hypothetical protein KIL84_014265 [Mauremys mutica]